MNPSTRRHAPRGTQTVKARARFVHDERGVVMNEYVVVMGFVGVVSIPAFTYLGYVVAHNFSFLRTYLLFMYP